MTKTPHESTLPPPRRGMLSIALRCFVLVPVVTLASVSALSSSKPQPAADIERLAVSSSPFARATHSFPALRPPPPQPSPETLPPCTNQPAVTEVELAEVLYDGYVATFGRVPTFNRIACAWAQCALEHGRGKTVFGNNIGHITTSGRWSGQTCRSPSTERTRQGPTGWQSIEVRFRVHADLAAGAKDYWQVLRNHYHSVLELCDQGLAREAALRLGTSGYFTAPGEPYAKAMESLFWEAQGRILPKVERPFWEHRRRPTRHTPQTGAVTPSSL